MRWPVFLQAQSLCDALRNQMGGGGLAYYVPHDYLLLAIRSPTYREAKSSKRSRPRRAEVEEARVAFTAIRDSVKQADRGPEHAKRLQAARKRCKRSRLIGGTYRSCQARTSSAGRS